MTGQCHYKLGLNTIVINSAVTLFVLTGATDATAIGTHSTTMPTELSLSTAAPMPAPGGHENCVVFDSSLQLAWTVNRDASLISFLLLGCQSTDLKWVQYM